MQNKNLKFITHKVIINNPPTQFSIYPSFNIMYTLKAGEFPWIILQKTQSFWKLGFSTKSLVESDEQFEVDTIWVLCESMIGGQRWEHKTAIRRRWASKSILYFWVCQVLHSSCCSCSTWGSGERRRERETGKKERAEDFVDCWLLIHLNSTTIDDDEITHWFFVKLCPLLPSPHKLWSSY